MEGPKPRAVRPRGWQRWTSGGHPLLPGLQTCEPGNCRGSGSFPTTWQLLAGFPRESGHKAGVVGPSMRYQGWAGSHWVTSMGGASMSNWGCMYVLPLQGILCSSSWLDFTLPQGGLGSWHGDSSGSLFPSSPSC